MGGGPPGKPDEQARIARAEADTSLDARHRLIRPTPRVEHRAEYGVSRGKAWIQLDRFLEFCHRAIGARRPHADQSERKVGVRIPAVERRGAARQIELIPHNFVRDYRSSSDRPQRTMRSTAPRWPGHIAGRSPAHDGNSSAPQCYPPCFGGSGGTSRADRDRRRLRCAAGARRCAHARTLKAPARSWRQWR